MKKFFEFMLVMLMCVCVLFMTSCGSEISNDPTVEDFENNEPQKYFLKVFGNEEEYLNFLEKFDFKNYEIFDVSIDGYGAGKYIVTYRIKSVTEENINTSESTIAIKEILQSDSDYVVIANDGTVTIVSKSVSKIVVSVETNVVILEKNGDTITKATFCVTQEMFESLN